MAAKTKRKTSDAGIAILKAHEGFSSKKYLDTKGLPTIGYGTLIDETNEAWLLTAKISKEEATALLKKDLIKFENVVNSSVKVFLNQYQFDALVCFCYNVGDGAFKQSTLLKMINKDPNDPMIKDQFMRWNKERVTVKGQSVVRENKGLSRRRLQELNLYFTKEELV